MKQEKKQPWMKFYPSDWRGDARLRLCSLAARGLWIDLIAYMHEGNPYGHLTIDGLSPDTSDISALVSRPVTEVKKAMEELEAKQVFSRTNTGVVFSRRMVRDFERSAEAREYGVNGGNPEIRRGSVPKEQRFRPFKRADAPQKTKRIFEKSSGLCHWCNVELLWVWDGKGQQPANLFHVDHVTAICDGGTNDEENLVAACAACNHRRAREPRSGYPNGGGHDRT